MTPLLLKSPYTGANMARPTTQRGTDFGTRLAQARKDAGLTQIQFAEKLGVSQQMVDYYERRARNPSAELLRKLSDVLGVTADSLLGTSAPKVKRGPPSAWEKRIEAIQGLPRDKQREIQNVVDALLAKAS